MKRFTDTEKWSDPWFRRLSSPAKQLWGYLCDHCNVVGLVELDLGLATIDCGQPITAAHIAELGDRVEDCGNGKFLLPKFVHFQYGELNEQCPPHKTVLRQIKSLGLVKDGASFRYPKPTLSLPKDMPTTTHTVGNDYPQDKTRQDRTGQEQEKGSGEKPKEPATPTPPPHEFFDEFRNEVPETLRTPAFMASLAKWHSYKRERRETYKPIGAKGLLARLEKVGPPARVIEAIEHSIANNYAGVFEPRPSHEPQRPGNRPTSGPL